MVSLSADRSGARRRTAAAMILVFAVVVAMVGKRWAETGGGQAELLETVPPVAARLAEPPDKIRLTFSEELNTGRTHVTAVEAGHDVATGEPVVTGDTVLLPVALGVDTQVFVGYHAVLRDGREIQGGHSFVVGEVASPRAPPEGLDSVSSGAHAHGEMGWLGSAAALLIVIAGTGLVLIAACRPHPRR